MKRALVTGSSGLIGSEAVTFLDRLGWAVHGIDNNMRRDFFGPDGDTTWNLERLQHETPRFTHHELDIRDRDAIARPVQRERGPISIIHCAAQPSHDLAASRPLRRLRHQRRRHAESARGGPPALPGGPVRAS